MSQGFDLPRRGFPRAFHRARLAGACAALLLACGVAQAQWAWREPNGSTTYSDVPPPASVRQEDILRRPSAATLPAPRPDTGESAGTAAAPAAEGAPAAARSGPKTLAEQDADFRKRREERAKAEQKQAEDDARAARRAADCSQARGYLEMIQSNMRLMRPNADGTRGYMDDDTRASETAKAQESVAKNCN